MNTVKVTFGNTVTVAEVTVEVADVEFIFIGEAKLHPRDRYDRDIGELYAVSRAMKNAHRLLDAIATGKVNDNNSWDKPRSWQANNFI